MHNAFEYNVSVCVYFIDLFKGIYYWPNMLALCWHNSLAYYAFIMLAYLTEANNQVTAKTKWEVTFHVVVQYGIGLQIGFSLLMI